MNRKVLFVSGALFAALLLPLALSSSTAKPAAAPRVPLEVTYYFLPG